MIEPPQLFRGLNCTINTTEDCNLRCRYCYETGKNRRNVSLADCRRFVDIILGDSSGWTGRMRDAAGEGIILDFIGGDSLMDWRLVDSVMEYFVYRINALDHPSKNRWRFSLCSNGTLFSPEVKRFLEKWRDCLSLGVSVDGCPELHDMNRVYPDGGGSMERILKDWDWYRSTFPLDSRITKSTLSRNSIPYLHESLAYMHEVLGIRYVFQNFVMEDCGLAVEDLDLFDREMEKCIGYARRHSDDLYWSMIDRRFLERRNPEEPLSREPMCGSGCMPCLSTDGRIYPCFRWLPHTRRGPVPFDCGDVRRGLVMEGFEAVSEGSRRNVCTRESKCLECVHEPCCSYCIGGCHAETGDFIRLTHICEIIRRQCHWAEEYWNGKKDQDAGGSGESPL